MNPIMLIFLGVFLVFLFIIYILFKLQGIDIFSEVFNLLYSGSMDFFGDSFYLLMALTMVVIVIIALILFRISSGK